MTFFFLLIQLFRIVLSAAKGFLRLRCEQTSLKGGIKICPSGDFQMARAASSKREEKEQVQS